MNAIQSMIDALRNFRRREGEYLLGSVRENEAVVIDMNAEEQLFERGENRLGVSIADYRPYSPVTVEEKRIRGQPYNRVTLRDTGDFESSFYIRYTGDSFEIAASDWKTDDLVRKYGKEIFGLNRDNLDELIRSYILPFLREKLIETINDRK
ncbi:hypothetical protein [Alistipes finegoldii]|jgi:hypothetical protein|uniref:hypothetical protein n=1 Tax=Alistipes finegoldii TaxID=214856 RepID=UPI00206469A7|nr:MAG TPA: hypothetical protein [Caudoviricetes sp.]